MRAVFATLLVALLAVGNGCSNRPPDHDICSDDDQEANARLSACTRIIDDPKMPPDFRAEAYVNRGEIYGNKEFYESAIEEETEALRLKPNYAEAYNLRAWIYFRAGKLREALADAEKAVSLEPSSADALDTRGHIYEALGRKDEAISDYRKALSLDSDLSESRVGLLRLDAKSHN